MLAARYIENRHLEPPVLFDDLLKMDIEPTLRAAIDRLLEVKKRTTEAEQLPHIPEIQSFIRDELPRQKAIGAAMPDDRNRDWAALNRFFMETVT